MGYIQYDFWRKWTAASLIEELINAKKIVYLIQHSIEDLEIIIKLKKQFQNNENVILIVDDLNVIELENVIKNFDFINRSVKKHIIAIPVTSSNPKIFRSNGI